MLGSAPRGHGGGAIAAFSRGGGKEEGWVEVNPDGGAGNCCTMSAHNPGTELGKGPSRLPRARLRLPAGCLLPASGLAAAGARSLREAEPGDLTLGHVPAAPTPKPSFAKRKR